MSVTPKALVEGKFAAASDTVVYTTPANTHTIVDKFTATNIDSSSRTITVHLVPSGATADDSNVIYKTFSIATITETDLTAVHNHILNPGDMIVVAADTASKVSFRVSGRECT